VLSPAVDGLRADAVLLGHLRYPIPQRFALDLTRADPLSIPECGGAAYFHLLIAVLMAQGRADRLRDPLLA
jgi:hypothetical protein